MNIGQINADNIDNDNMKMLNNVNESDQCVLVYIA